jgi:hypothetical protein
LCGGGAGTAYGYHEAHKVLPDYGPVKCVDSEMTCIPRLQAARVVAALKAQGHSCSKSFDRWECALQVGVTKYTFALDSVGGQVHKYSARANTGPTAAAAAPIKPSKAVRAYLQWSAQLPYAHDPQFAAQIRTWLDHQIDTGGKTEANVGHYGFEFDTSQPNEVDLTVEAVAPE